MMVISMTIQDAFAARVIDAFAASYSYSATITDNTTNPPITIPNPQTKAQFAKAKIGEYIKSVVVAYERPEGERRVTEVAHDLEIFRELAYLA